MCSQIRPGCEIYGLITTRCVPFWTNRGKYQLEFEFCFIKTGQFWLWLLCMSLTNDNKTPCHCCYENADVLTNRKRYKCCYDTPATLSWQKKERKSVRQSVEISINWFKLTKIKQTNLNIQWAEMGFNLNLLRQKKAFLQISLCKKVLNVHPLHFLWRSKL